MATTLPQVSRTQKSTYLKQANCSECPFEDGFNPVLGNGADDADVVIVGEAPGYSEYSMGVPFSGRSGKLLDATLQEVGLTRKETFTTNAILCRPSSWKKGAPPASALKACRPRLIAEIKDRNPKIVIGTGASSIHSINESREAMKDVIGEVRYKEELETHTVFTFHPSAVLHGATNWYDHILMTFKRSAMLVKGDIPYPNPNDQPSFDYLTTTAECASALNEIKALQRVATDLETAGFRYTDDILLIAFGTDQHAWILEASVVLTDRMCRQLLQEILSNDLIIKILHNAIFDFQFFKHYLGIVPDKFIDTMALALGTTEQAMMIGLEKQSQQWLNAATWKDEIKKYAPKKTDSYDLVPRHILARYAARDVINTYKLAPILTRECEKEGTLEHVEKYLYPAIRTFTNIEYRGIKIDFDYIEELRQLWPPKMQDVTLELQEAALNLGFLANKVTKKPKSLLLNPNSSKQLAHLFYDILKFNLVDGRRTTDASFLKQYEDHELVKKLTWYRQTKKMYATYVEGIADDVWPDGAVHPAILLWGTVTGRLSIARPPMQTIPKEELLKKRGFSSIKKIFIARKGLVFVEADYRQNEVRVAWHYSGDEQLGEACMSEDFHVAAASKAFKIPKDQVTPEIRHRSKFISFGIMYGRQAYSMTDELNCTEREAQGYIDEFFAAFPKYHAWWKKQQKDAFIHTELQTTVGRKRRWALITRDNAQHVQNQSVNFPIQSLSADMCLESLCKLDKLLRDRELGYALTTVHDSNEFEIRKDRVDEGCRLIREVMLKPSFETCATFDVEIKVGPSWGETKVWQPSKGP